MSSTKGFQKGHKHATGRPPGAPNRRGMMLEETAQRIGCDPFEVLLLFSKGDWKALGYDSEKLVTMGKDGEFSEEYVIKPGERIQAAKEAAQYLYSKKKSIEHITQNTLEGMTPEQKLEAMKQAVRMLEGQIEKK